MQPQRAMTVTDAGPARLLVVVAALCFATTGTAQALGPDGASPLAVGAARVLVGAGGLLLVTAWTSGRLALPVSAPVLWGGLGVAGYQASFFLAVRTTGVAVGTVVALGSAPVLVGLWSWWRGGRAPGTRWTVSTACAVAGLALLASARGGDGVDPRGVLLALGAAVSYAAYTLSTKALIDSGSSTVGAVTAVFTAGAVLGLPLLAAGDGAPLRTGAGLAMTLWLGLVTTTFAYVLFARGLGALPAAEVSTLTLAEPVAATLLGLGLLDERPGPAGALGIVLIVVGLAVLVVRRPG